MTVSLRDEHRGAIVGQKTAGALEGGHYVSLPAGGMFIRLSEVAGPKYEQIEGFGIMPDVEVSLTESDMEKGQDPQLDAAVKAVSGG